MKELLINFNKSLQGEFEEFWSEIAYIGKKNILWYPSSRFDWRPTVLFLDKEIDRLNQHGKKLPKVDLYIYNNLEPQLFYSILDKKDKILFQDKKTKITLKEIIPTTINRLKFNFQVNPDHYDFAHYYNLTDRHMLPDSAILKLNIQSETHGKHDSWVIFLEAENFNVFEEVFLKYKICPAYLCNAYEGIAWGGCARSFSDYFMGDYLKQEECTFKPEFLIRNEGFVINNLKEGKDYKEKFFDVNSNKVGTLNLVKQYAWDDQTFGRYANMYQISYPE